MIDRRTCLALMAATLTSPALAQAPGVSTRTAFGFSFPGINGKTIRLSDYAGKPILVVNTASLCGFTPHYAKLQQLWTKMGPSGLVVIGVPSNDFGSQEPGGASEITATTSSYGITFPMAAKAVVTGAEAHPFYKWAASEKPRDLPRWNFHKYLVGADGHIAAVFSTFTDPTEPQVVAAIEHEFRSAG